jgi:hypothetical protein
MESSKNISNKKKFKIANYQQRGGWDKRERQVRAVNGEINIYTHTKFTTSTYCAETETNQLREEAVNYIVK